MGKRITGSLLIGLVVALSIILGSCDLSWTSYTIQVRLGHQNADDPNSVTFTLSDLPPKNLVYTGWFPSGDSFYEYTVKLKKASDFTVVVETNDGSLYSQTIPIEDGYRYSIYYQNQPVYDNIFSYGEPY